MHADHFRELILRAVASKDEEILMSIAWQLAASAEAHAVLRAKGYGVNGMMIDATVRLVPSVK
ncbi:MAG: hypothetical protein V4684_19375 [Pseudomonadota bacterium]